MMLAMYAGFLLLGARIARIENRSYIRALIAFIISFFFADLVQVMLVPAIGRNNWGAVILDAVLYQACYFLPIPLVFRTGFRKSLVAYVILVAGLITVALIGILVLRILGLPIPRPR